MRRFLTLICLLGLALPAGISISGCVRNPQGNYCNGLGYGPKDTDVFSIVMQPQLAGISLAYGQTTQVQSPTAYTCKGNTASVGSNLYSYGTTYNGQPGNQIADISPSGILCAGTWNRNTGGGIADYTNCNFPNPLPSTSGLPYAVAYLTATAYSVTSNPVPVYIHAPVTAVTLATTPLAASTPQSCFSQNQQAELDALSFYNNNGTQTLFCQPSATANVAAYAVNSNVVTLTAANNFVAGERIKFSGLSVATFLNNQTLTVLGTGLSNTQFEVAATAANTATTADSGVAATTASIPSCGSSIGTFSFTASNSSVASIAAGTSTNPLSTITALQPGTTTITANIAQTSSLAGSFSTCPPASIKVALANGTTSGIITQGVSQNLTTTVYDTRGTQISGLSLDYESTNPIDISVASGAITPAFPGVASVYAVCEPPSCNPAPINEFGLNGTGLPLSSNPVSITVPGTTSDYVWFGAPGQSQYFASIELLTGNPGSTVRLPFVPNSMVMDQLGNNLYFGSPRELMVYSTASNSLTKQDATVPGVVLAASPNGSQLLINDPLRGVFYLYSISGGNSSTYPGMGVAAAWTPDSNTLYIVDSSSLGGGHTNTLYVDSVNTGWSTYDLSSIGGAQNLAVTIPGVGAYLAGSLATVAHAWCPSGMVGSNNSLLFYPQTDDVSLPATDVVGATSDGAHILGASPSGGSGINLADFGVAIPDSVCPGVVPNGPLNGDSLTALSTGAKIINQNINLNAGTNVTVSTVDQVVTGTAPTTASVTTAAPIAFVTYSASSTTGGATLPYYLPGLSGAMGVPGSVTVSDCAATLAGNTPNPAYPCNSTITAPLAGAFSPDNSLFFVSTAGDNEIHFISIPTNLSTTAPPTENIQLHPAYSPNLPACTPVSAGGNDAGCLYPIAPAANTYVPATVITVKPRSVT